MTTRERFLEYRDRYLPAIRRSIDDVVADADLEDSSLAKMLANQMDTGGKRLRAVLPLMVADALGEEAEKLIPFGAACELIHNATLIHDDLQDGDRVRRGKPAIWVKYGEAQAINLGDALLYLAPLCMDRVDVDAETRWAVSSLIFRQVLQVIDGQEREFELEFGTSTRGDYDRMVIGKTSGLFALPMTGAARICGADARAVNILQRASRHLGVLFQIQDDILDLYGEKGREAPGGDLREGKISALVVAFSELAPEAEVERLRTILEADRDQTSQADVAWAIEAFREHGALNKGLETIEKRRREATEIDGLSEFPEIAALIDGLIDLFLDPISGLI